MAKIYVIDFEWRKTKSAPEDLEVLAFINNQSWKLSNSFICFVRTLLSQSYTDLLFSEICYKILVFDDMSYFSRE